LCLSLSRAAAITLLHWILVDAPPEAVMPAS
jgi:hypothetical protein